MKRPTVMVGSAGDLPSGSGPGARLLLAWGPAMEILALITVLLLLWFAATWSSARSYFSRGRLAGMEEAAREVFRGVRSYYEVAGRSPPEPVTKAMEAVGAFAQGVLSEANVQHYQAKLSMLGDAIGSACWRKGFETCKQQMRPHDDRIRIDLSMNDLINLAELAHIGFKRMMPNDRAIEMVRFAGEDHAILVNRAVERLEQAIPAERRPSGHSATRQTMIRNWWPLERKSA
jgi:hypothetical protein